MRTAVCLWCLMLFAAQAIAQPIVSDTRIKTLVYNPNEVFTITTHYGYQANIEFGAKEEIETVSVGDRVGWQIVPAGRRLFIRAMEENAHTNMTVITNRRAYQFDLRSSASNAVYGSEELVYVVRFFFPEESGFPQPSATLAVPMSARAPALVMAAPTPPVASAPLPEPVASTLASASASASASVSAPVSPPASAAPVSVAALPAPNLLEEAPAPLQPRETAPMPRSEPGSAAAGEAINYRYTYTGPSEIAPVKIFDDGTATYFKFRPGAPLPRVAVLAANGEEISVPYQINAEGFAVIKLVAPRFSLRENGYEVVVYNEAKFTG